jgi:putative endonuclease
MGALFVSTNTEQFAVTRPPRCFMRKSPPVPLNVWHVYLARCADDTLYCGIARNVSERIAAHDAGKGARYTRGRGPLQVLATQRCLDQGLALRVERAVKGLTRTDKLALAENPAELARLARKIRRRQVSALSTSSR